MIDATLGTSRRGTRWVQSGTDLARRYALEVVEPVLDRHLPGLPRAIGRLGTGSDVLGLDDEVSRDHDWGLRLTLLVEPAMTGEVDALLERHLPTHALGLPVRFGTTGDGDVRHRVEVDSVRGLATSRLGVDPGAGLTIDDWLALTGQAVLEVTGGEVFADGPGELTRLRDALSWYPDELWPVLVAVDWQRLGQELPLAARAGQVGDHLGSRVLAARLVDVAVHLGFLLERRWAPYPKWRGTLFAALPTAGRVAPLLERSVTDPTWPGRHDSLAAALRSLHDLQRSVGLPVVDGDPLVAFHDRPWLVPRDAVAARLLDGAPAHLRRHWPVGSVEQWVGSVDVLTEGPLRARVSGAAHRLG